jgi:predicted naringenin-chalcone synthase
MSSASVMFVLRELMLASAATSGVLPGRALAFGPGLTVETLDFTAVPACPRPTSLPFASELVSV